MKGEVYTLSFEVYDHASNRITEYMSASCNITKKKPFTTQSNQSLKSKSADGQLRRFLQFINIVLNL